MSRKLVVFSILVGSQAACKGAAIIWAPLLLPALVGFTDRAITASRSLHGTATSAGTQAYNDLGVLERRRAWHRGFEHRYRLASGQRAADIDYALRVTLPGQLREIWEARDEPARERRFDLFEQWCETNDEMTGRQAREIIARFIAEHLPPSSPEAFTAAELASLRDACPDRIFEPSFLLR